jgi:threonine/homoserine/homoserine lactone efflux protein
MVLWLALLRGLVLGFVGSIPVGPVNAAVIDTALRKCFRRALAIGLGGAFIDFIYSQIAVAVLKPFMDRVPGMATALLGLGGVVLVIFGVIAVKSPPTDNKVHAAPPVRMKRELVASFFTGCLITLMNPAALVSWVLLAGTVLADLTRHETVFAGAGIFIGTSAWFCGIAWLASKGRVRLGHRAAWITRAVGALLVIYGVFLVGKASHFVWAHR